MKITGFSLNKGKDGEFVAKPGKQILPHRIDLIKKLMLTKNNLDNVFFNFNISEYDTCSTLNQIDEEIKLFEQYRRSRNTF